MSLSLVLSTNLLLFIFYAVKSKSLQLLEIIFCWMIVVFLYGLFNAVVSTNLHLLIIEVKLDSVFSYYVFKFFLIPLLFIWCIDLISSTHQFISKLLLHALFTALLTSAEYAADWLHFLRHAAHWRLWWSIVTWELLIVFVACLFSWFRNLFQKELKT